MEQNKILNKPFKQTFHSTDIKQNIIGIPFITKYIPTKNILNSKLHIKDKYTRTKNTSLTFFQRLNKQPPFFSKFYPIYQIIQQRKTYKKQWRSSKRKTHRILKQKYYLSKHTKKNTFAKRKNMDNSNYFRKSKIQTIANTRPRNRFFNRFWSRIKHFIYSHLERNQNFTSTIDTLQNNK